MLIKLADDVDGPLTLPFTVPSSVPIKLVEYVFLNYQIDLVIIGFNNQEQLKELIDSENIDFSNFKRKFNTAIDSNIINPIKWPK